jgi:hypothetical protein
MKKSAIIAASVFSLVSCPGIAGVCNSVGSHTYCSDEKGNQTSVWNYGNGNYNTQTTDSKGKTRSEYYHNWSENGESDKD